MYVVVYPRMTICKTIPCHVLTICPDVTVSDDGSVKNWNDMAILLPGRTNKDCHKSWYKVRSDIRKGLWTKEEDKKLQDAIAQLGGRGWMDGAGRRT